MFWSIKVSRQSSIANSLRAFDDFVIPFNIRTQLTGVTPFENDLHMCIPYPTTGNWLIRQHLQKKKKKQKNPAKISFICKVAGVETFQNFRVACLIQHEILKIMKAINTGITLKVICFILKLTPTEYILSCDNFNRVIYNLILFSITENTLWTLPNTRRQLWFHGWVTLESEPRNDPLISMNSRQDLIL